jgi:hypothetical protein
MLWHNFISTDQLLDSKVLERKYKKYLLYAVNDYYRLCSQKVLANRYGNSIYNLFTFCIIILDRTGLRGGGGAGGHSGGRMIEGGG